MKMKMRITASELRPEETFMMRNLKFVHHGDLQVERLTGEGKGLQGCVCPEEEVWVVRGEE